MVKRFQNFDIGDQTSTAFSSLYIYDLQCNFSRDKTELYLNCLQISFLLLPLPRKFIKLSRITKISI